LRLLLRCLRASWPCGTPALLRVEEDLLGEDDRLSWFSLCAGIRESSGGVVPF
jgi:hypothetical protein